MQGGFCNVTSCLAVTLETLQTVEHILSEQSQGQGLNYRTRLINDKLPP